MAAATITSVMDGITTRLKTIVGLNVGADLTDANMPVALVGLPADFAYHGTFAHGRIAWQPEVLVFVAKQIDQVGLRTLAGFLDVAGASSIHAAVEQDKTLAGVAEDCIVEHCRAMTEAEIGRYGYVGAVLTLKVMAKGA